jgi:hypothetical protein
MHAHGGMIRNGGWNIAQDGRDALRAHFIPITHQTLGCHFYGHTTRVSR